MLLIVSLLIFTVEMSEHAVKEDPQTRDQLLNRKAQLSVRLSLKARLLLYLLKSRRNDDDNHYAGFDLPCHV